MILHHHARTTFRRPTLSNRDLFTEAVAGVLQRPARSALTSLGTILGVGAFIAVLGLTGTATAQIDSRFSTLTATEVTVQDTGGHDSSLVPLGFPSDSDARIQRLHGVTAAGVFWKVRLRADQTARATLSDTNNAGDSRTQLTAASPGALRAARPHFSQGRAFDSYHSTSKQNVAVLGSAAAARLGITTLQNQPAIFIGTTPFTVIGVFDDIERKPELLMSILIPHTTAERVFGPPSDERATMLISTQLGAAAQIAAEAPLALRPDHPEYFKPLPPADPRTLRGGVGSDLGTLFLLLAAICLVIGAVGIANTTLVAVMERTAEIGLRRALGARGSHITIQFLAESASLGLLGGVIGASLGTVTVVTVSAVKQWTPVIAPLTLAAAPALGLATGLLAGLYPAWRASRVPPAEALRR
ncbi:ABC transporter permease [Streptomyces sp. NPDC059819]|uniref:ABC transporter permease n=1 Tax=Streptomyces sp. NPDC059819 TaxID=3346963 RepID=UPI00364CB98D